MDRATICDRLMELEMQREAVIKSRIMQWNRLRAIIAGSLGYHSRMEEADRKEKFDAADRLLDNVLAKFPEGARRKKKPIDNKVESEFTDLILATHKAVGALVENQKTRDKDMLDLAEKLPICDWVCDPQQAGFGMQSLTTVIGNSGDLIKYSNPAKLWRRFGCYPFEFDGQVRMGQAWKLHGLPAEKWIEFGYSPRRRSKIYVIGENLMKQNHGVYRKRYDDAKETFRARHPDAAKIHVHKHAMLLASKLLLKNLWIEWHKLAKKEAGSREVGRATEELECCPSL